MAKLEDTWPQLKKWDGKTMGKKPSTENLKFATTECGCREGSKAGFAQAMFNRPNGATRKQIIAACGAPQMNKRKELAGKPGFSGTATGPQGATIYTLTKKVKAKAKKKAAATPEADATTETSTDTGTESETTETEPNKPVGDEGMSDHDSGIHA